MTRFHFSSLVLNFILVLQWCSLTPATAEVDLKNGNYYTSFTDLIAHGNGPPLSLVRHYNSKSDFLGVFGRGWNTQWETRLEVSAEGMIFIFDSGGGATKAFATATTVAGKKKVAEIVETIIEKMKGRYPDVTSKQIENTVAQLMQRPLMRHQYAKAYGLVGKAAIGTQLQLVGGQGQSVKVLKKGYLRKFADGRMEKFDHNGRLVALNSAQLGKLLLRYSKSGRLKKIVDAKGKELIFEWFESGLVRSVARGQAPNRKTVYQYDEKLKLLTMVKTVNGETFQYHYNRNQRLSKITYGDQTTYEIDYHQKFLLVSKIKNRMGRVVEYTYSDPHKNPLLYWTKVKSRDANGVLSEQTYEYEHRKKSLGQSYLYRKKVVIDDHISETKYSPQGQPLSIKNGAQLIRFQYNQEGFLLKKTSNTGQFIEYEYHPKHKKITRVNSNAGWSKYQYDKSGEIKKASNSAGEQFLLVYNRYGKITNIKFTSRVDKSRAIIQFVYNSLGRPVEVSLNGGKSVKIEYDDLGQVVGPKKKSQRETIEKITRIFQRYIELVRPAGENLSIGSFSPYFQKSKRGQKVVK